MDNNKPKSPIPLPLLAFEMAGFLLGMYFIMNSTVPDSLKDLGLPVIIQGNVGLFTGVICIIIGVVPLLRWLIAQQANKS